MKLIINFYHSYNYCYYSSLLLLYYHICLSIFKFVYFYLSYFLKFCFCTYYSVILLCYYCQEILTIYQVQKNNLKHYSHGTLSFLFFFFFLLICFVLFLNTVMNIQGIILFQKGCCGWCPLPPMLEPNEIHKIFKGCCLHMILYLVVSYCQKFTSHKISPYCANILLLSSLRTSGNIYFS